MLAGALRTLYGYDAWATGRVLDETASLDREQLLAPAPGDQRSIRDTLVHIIGTQVGWRSWWDGSLPAAEAYALTLDPDDFPDVATIRGEWLQVQAQTDAFVSSLDDVDAERVLEDRLPDGTEVKMQLWPLMLHVANHGTQHRSEVAAQLTAFGHSPGQLDMLHYVWQPGA